MEKVEEVGDFVVGEAEVSEVIVIHCFGIVGDAPSFGFEVALVIELQDFAKSSDAAIVEVGGGEGDVTKAGCAKFTEIFGIFSDGVEARIFFANRGCSEVVVSKIREERLIPVLRFEEVAVGATGGGFVDFEAAFLGKGECLFIPSLVAVIGGIEGAEGGGFEEFNECAESLIGELCIVADEVLWEEFEVG